MAKCQCGRNDFERVSDELSRCRSCGTEYLGGEEGKILAPVSDQAEETEPEEERPAPPTYNTGGRRRR